ncbi:hypothetical protein Aduo_006120 [Ancylostoma duodenale]
MEKTIGSKIKQTIDQHRTCRKNRWCDHGRCVLPMNTTCPDFTINTDQYKCECDKGYVGDFCSSEGTTPQQTR